MSSRRDRPVYRKGDGLASEQPLLLGDPLEERLKSEPLVLGLRELVESVLGEELRKGFSRSGGYSYDPAGLLCVWMYGLMKGVTSSRRLEEACRYDVRYEYLCRSCQPDHTTLSRFRHSLGDTLDALFVRIALAAREENLITGRVAMVDGTKIPAARSQWKKLLGQADIDDPPDGETMKSYGRYFYGYNVQMAVDMDSGMVLGHAATTSSNDLASMEELLCKVESQSGVVPEKVVADKGYSSHPNAHALDSRGIDGFLPPMRGPAPFSPGEDGSFQCAAGHRPSEGKVYDRAYDTHYRELRVSKCSNCQISATCGSGSGAQRRQKLPTHLPFGDLRRANLNALDPTNQPLMRSRAPTIERIFGILKWCMGLSRFKLKTTAGAHLEFGLTALAYNLRRLIRALWKLFCLSLTESRPHFDLQKT